VNTERLVNTMPNDFSNKTTILAELWMNYRDDEQLKDFIEYNDLGLPMAYFLMNELVLPTKQSEVYVNETYELLISSLGAQDLEFESLDELLNSIQE
jgi:hypothetical protein